MSTRKFELVVDNLVVGDAHGSYLVIVGRGPLVPRAVLYLTPRLGE